METEIRIEQQNDGRWLVILVRPVLEQAYGPYDLPEAQRQADRLRNLYRSENGAVLERVAQAVHDGMQADGLKPSACIAGAAAIRDLLSSDAADETAGILPVELVAVTAAAFNAPGWRLLLAHSDPHRDPARWAADGAWSVGLGFGADPEPGRWPGHLVAVVDRRWLVDPTLGQASRPDRGLTLPDILVLPLTERWVRGREDTVIRLPGDTTVTVARRRNAPSFQHSPDWRESRRRTQRVAAALALLQAEEAR
jgi:hypothetical protein